MFRCSLRDGMGSTCILRVLCLFDLAIYLLYFLVSISYLHTIALLMGQFLQLDLLCIYMLCVSELCE